MILVAVLAGVVAGTIPPVPVKPGEIPNTERMPNFYSQPAKCGPMHDEITRRVRTASGPQLKPIYAVMRKVDGCGVPTPVGYHPDYLLPGKADAPARRTAPR
jgi:hypothetical protein